MAARNMPWAQAYFDYLERTYMDDAKQHAGLPVAGYKPQSNSNVEQVNSNKRTEEALLRVCDALKDDHRVDQRWLSIARTSFEQGFMAMNRAIFKPGRVTLPGDTDQA